MQLYHCSSVVSVGARAIHARAGLLQIREVWRAKALHDSFLSLFERRSRSNSERKGIVGHDGLAEVSFSRKGTLTPKNPHPLPSLPCAGEGVWMTDVAAKSEIWQQHRNFICLPR